jgi:hypothetical protein
MGEWRYNHAFLNPALGGGEWSTLRPGRFTPRAQLLVRNEYEAGRAPKDGVDALVNGKKSLTRARRVLPSSKQQPVIRTKI